MARTFDMPMEEPSLAGFTMIGSPSLRAVTRKFVSLPRSSYFGVGSFSAAQMRLVRSLSIASAEASTPLPV